jgi:dipeptidyl-peptidase 4
LSREFESITLKQIARLPRPGTSGPSLFRFTPDGEAILYLHSEDESLMRSLWRYDIATGERSVLAGPAADESPLSREEELRRERQRLLAHGVTSYEVADKTQPLTVLIPGSPKLRLFHDGQLSEIPGTERAEAPHLNAHGTAVAFVRDNEIVVKELAGGDPRQLTRGSAEGLTNGLAEFIAQEELGRADGFWWSPDGSRIAYIQADSNSIEQYPIVHQGKDVIALERHRYPFSGGRNAQLRVGVVDLATAETTWIGLPAEVDVYIPNVSWRPDGMLAVQVLSRDQRRLQLIVIDPADARRLASLEETNEPWLNTHDDHVWLDDGSLVWPSERGGFRHLYLYDADLRPVRQLTGGEWVVTQLIRVDENARTVYFMSTRESALERHLYSVSLDGGEPNRLTEGSGWHGCSVAIRGGQFVDTLSTLKRAPVTTLARPGSESVVLHEPPESAHSLGLAPPRLFQLPGADGTPLDAALYEPVSDSDRPAPLVVSVYGGPHAQRVMDEWSLTVDLRAQYLAQHGFAVLRVDNRGSANRGLAFEAHIADRMGMVEVEDQTAAVRKLASDGVIDPDRVGIYGWSYGGYMSAMCMLREPELFKVGVAGAPVVDWDGYDTCYTERYMRTPEQNPDGYRDGALTTHVANLAGKLMLVHGMVDENVHFRHTARLITALTAAQKEYDLMLFPEERHVPRAAAGLEYMERRLTNYFLDNL